MTHEQASNLARDMGRDEETGQRVTTAHGLTMRWILCRNHFGKPVVRGWVDNVERMGCELRRYDYATAERAVIARLGEIGREAVTHGR